MKKIFYISALFLTGMACNCSAQTAVENKITTINITNFHVYAKDAKLTIEWSTDGTKPTNYWEVQRSTENAAFSTIALVLGPDPSQSGEKFQYVEKLKDSKNSTASYRLVHVNADGTEQVSNIIQPTK